MRWTAIVLVAVLGLSAAASVRAQQREIPVTPLPPGTQLPTPTRIRVGGTVEAAKLTSHLMPVYPPIAIQAHISGTVVLHVVIASDGTVKEASAVSGPQIFLQSAIDAVKQWQYQPTLFNGQPVEVDTTVTVVYELSGEEDQELTPSVEVEGVPPLNPASGAQPAGATQPIDPQLKADIQQMLDKMHVSDTGKAMFQNIYQAIRPTILRTLPDTPDREKIADAYGQKLGNLMTSDEFTDGITEIYAKYFSDADVKALIAFYGTPTGQRLLAVAPQIATDGQRLGMRIAMEHVAGIFKELCEEYPELQGKASFCAAGSTETKGELDHHADNRSGN